jgi:hypothetical protein
MAGCRFRAWRGSRSCQKSEARTSRRHSPHGIAGILRLPGNFGWSVHRGWSDGNREGILCDVDAHTLRLLSGREFPFLGRRVDHVLAGMEGDDEAMPPAPLAATTACSRCAPTGVATALHSRTARAEKCRPVDLSQSRSESVRLCPTVGRLLTHPGHLVHDPSHCKGIRCVAAVG